MPNENKLRGRITEKYRTLGNFAKAVNIPRQTIALKLSGKREFKASEILAFCKYLDIDYSDIAIYFFA